MATKIVSLVNRRPELIELQLRSFQKYLLDPNYEYIVVNNARGSSLMATLLKCVAERNFSPVVAWGQWRSSASQAISNRRKISEECRRLNVKEFQITTSPLSCRSRSAEPSTVVAYSLNETFRQISFIADEDTVCLIDSDIFLTSAVSFDSFLFEKEVALIPQLRGLDVVYPWTGFMIARGSFMRESDFGLGLVRGVRTDVGGKLSKRLESIPETQRAYLQFLNFRQIESANENARHYSVSLNGNFEAKFGMTHNGDLDYFQSQFEVGALSANQHLLGISDQKSFAERFHNLASYFKDAEFTPLNVDLIGQIGPSEQPFALHYKNASNPRDFDDQSYFKSKFDWIRKLL